MALSHAQIKPLISKEDPVLLEIGSNDGTDALALLDLFDQGVIHCFEPDPRAANRWEAQVNDSRAHLHRLALGSKNGTAQFHQSGGNRPGAAPDGWDYSGSLRAPKEHLTVHPDVTFETVIDVDVRRLDTWSSDNGIDTIDFIWADVQGAERDLIEGGRETLDRTRFFYTEYDRREMYEGQWHWKTIAQALPNHEVIRKWRKDILFALKSENATL